MKNDTHRDVQERLLNKLILILGIITIPALFISLFRFFSIGWKPVFNVHIIIAVFFFLISIYRNSIFYHVKVGIVVGIFCLLAISSSLNLGMMGFLVGFLLVSVFMGIIFWGKKQSFLIYLGGAVTILSIGILTVQGVISPKTDIGTYTKFLSSWITTTIGFTLIAGLSILIVGEIGHMLAEKINALKETNQKLQKAQDEISTLSGLIPICASCKKIRDDKGYWKQIESYIKQHSNAEFSHSICPDCSDKLYGNEDWYIKIKKNETIT